MFARGGLLHLTVGIEQALADVTGQHDVEQTAQIGFVERGGIADLGGQMPRSMLAITRKERGRLGVGPAALCRKPHRRGEMVERHHRR